MHRLPLRQRARVLDAMLDSHLFIVRELSMLLKIAATFALLGAPSARALSSYDRSGPVFRDAHRRSGATSPTRALPITQSAQIARREVA